MEQQTFSNNFEANVNRFGKTAILRKAKEEADKIFINNLVANSATLWIDICEALFKAGLFPPQIYPEFYEDLRKIAEGKQLES